MAERPYLEVNGYFCHYHAEPTADGQWMATVFFELMKDYGKPAVPGMKHTIRQKFATEHDAKSAARDLATKLASIGEVGL